MPLPTTAHSLQLNADAVAKGAQTDLDEIGVAKNAREELVQARRKRDLSPQDARRHAEMERLYRKHVLKEPTVPMVQIQGLKKSEARDETPVH